MDYFPKTREISVKKLDVEEQAQISIIMADCVRLDGSNSTRKGKVAGAADDGHVLPALVHSTRRSHHCQTPVQMLAFHKGCECKPGYEVVPPLVIAGCVQALRSSHYSRVQRRSRRQRVVEHDCISIHIITRHLVCIGLVRNVVVVEYHRRGALPLHAFALSALAEGIGTARI